MKMLSDAELLYRRKRLARCFVVLGVLLMTDGVVLFVLSGVLLSSAGLLLWNTAVFASQLGPSDLAGTEHEDAERR